MPIDHSRPTTVIFGCGYVGSRLARTLLSEGNPVRACSRHLEKLAQGSRPAHPFGPLQLNPVLPQ